MIADSVLQGFFKTVSTGLTIVKHNQEGKAPKLPYCTWQEISNPANGRAQIRYIDVSGTYTEATDINKTEAVQIDFYTKTPGQNKNKESVDYKSAYEFAEEMTLRLNTFSSLVYQNDNNIGVMDWTDLTPLTKFMGDNNELRATIEIFFNNSQSYTEEAYAVDLDEIDINLTTEGI